MCCHRPHNPCKPRCMKRCVGVYKVYEKCCHEVVKICPCCGHEFDHGRHPMCPMCGMPADDPPRFGGFGRFGRGRFGRFGGFGGFGRRRFPLFSPFVFGGFPFEEEEEEEEEEF